MLWFINCFSSLRLMRFGHFLFVWLDFRFVKAKIGRNSFVWKEMGTNSIQKSEKPERNVQHTKHFQPKSVLHTEHLEEIQPNIRVKCFTY